MTPNLATLTIEGPCWSADVDVVELQEPRRNLALRTLFLDTQARKVAGSAQVFAPGTLLALVSAREVRIQPIAKKNPIYRWTRIGGTPTLGHPAAIRAALGAGRAALLLLQADPALWPDKAGGKLPVLTCLAGDIGLDALKPEKSDTIQKLYSALALDLPPATPQPQQRPGAAQLVGALSVHSSGVSLYGRAGLPWEPAAERITGVFQLTRELADPSTGSGQSPPTNSPSWRLSLELERLTPDEAELLVAAWGRLSRALNPRNPLHGPALAGAPAPRWATLEIVDPLSAPRMVWPLTIWQEQTAALPLRFDRGMLNLLLTDQRPYDRAAPPASLARYLPPVVVVERAGATLNVTLGAPINRPADIMTYSAGRDPAAPGGWAEQISLNALDLALDPLDTPRMLRESQGLPAPLWEGPGSAVLEQPLLWGFMPLAEGWAQLPIPNLTEQIYLDGVPDTPEDPPATALLQGAVSLGNSDAQVLRARRDEQPWSLTLLDADALYGQWTLQQNTEAAFELHTIALTLDRPDVVIGGLLWLSTGRPTIADALPDMVNWVAGLRTVQLKSLRLAQKRFPPLVIFGLDQLRFVAADLQIEPAAPPDAGALAPRLPAIEFAAADLRAWTLGYRVDTALLGRLAAAEVGLLAPGVFGTHPPLVWQRHTTLPMIQALPLTQSQSPPNYPAASRQLAPFALPIVKQTSGGVTLDLPGAWIFGVTADRAAATWPSLRSAATPAEEWRALSDLPLAALSIAGLLLDPSASAAAQGLPGAMLPVQYRFDLPYADEINALAQLPKIPRDPAQVSPLPDEPPPTPPKPLTRETFGQHWLRLSERASLASADDVTAFDRVGAQAIVRHLVEPYTWDVETSFTATPYPGGLAIGNAASAPAPAAEEAALAGISGQFTQANGKLTRLPDGAPADGAFQLTSGSMAAALVAPGVLRDQRGLQRHASVLAGALLTTEVAQTTLAGQTSYQLTSTFEPYELRAGDGQTWRFWCRDLPVRAGDGLFDRSTAHSALRQDVNDPEALSSDYDYLGGYEWRIESNQAEDGYPALLRLYGLLFYPLTLDALQVRDGQIERVALTGRLQLALPTPAELTDLANPVQLSFTRDGAGLSLSAIQVSPERPPDDSTPNQIEWPLALAGDELSGAPRLRWSSVALQGRNIVVQDPKLEFFLFDVPWTLAVEPLVFTPEGGLAGPPVVETTTPDQALALVGAGLTLDLAGGQHAAFVDLLVRLGRQFLDPAAGPTRGAFTATVRFELPIARPEVRASWLSAVLFDDLPLDLARAELRYAGRSLQFTWEQVDSEVDARFQLLPGMHLLPSGAPGFAALAFDARALAGGAPSLLVASAFVEVLVYARWGAFLQDDGPLTAERVFGSSAGDLAFGYTAERQDGAWNESFLLNGFLEIKSLISWPLDLRYAESDRTLTLPAARGPNAASPLRHTRHTMRVLLNQQALDPALLAPGPGQLLFQLAPGQTWQFLAVVEHQLLDLLPTAAPGDAVAERGPQQRWTALQEVRILPRSSLIAFLETYGAVAARAFDPASGINTLSAAVDGSLRAGLRERLVDALDKLPDDTLLVEASAPHWISKRVLNDARPTTLQFLPGGSQHGILSGPQDYAPSAPHDPAWLLLTTPFLGRLQDAARDTAPAAPTASSLQRDPIQQLQGAPAGAALDGLLLALTNRGDDADARLRIADMDSSAGRTWARLDPLTLEENWFRVGAPRPEPPAERLQSVAAALPDTPARLSRSVALRRAFDVFRPSYPPADDGRYELPDEIAGAALVWRPSSIMVQQSLGDARAARGLVALYSFGEGSDTTVNDVSGVGSPLNLKISKAAAVTWLPGGGLRVSAPVVIASGTDTKKIFDACTQSQELTIEAWIKPASATPPTPSQPGRIVVLSKDSERRNFVMQQGTFDKFAAAHYHVRLHTDKTGDDKQPALATPEGSLTTALQHVVYTRDAAGQARLYVDGVQQAADSRPGKLEWNNKYQLVLANEPGGDRPWLGEYHLVAIYSQALTAGEVQSNFTARSRPAVYGWHTTGLLRASALAAAGGDAPAVQRHAAATLLPARLALDVRRRDGDQTVTETRANPLPLSFAISPYVGLAFRRAPAASELRLLLLAAELLCLDRASGAMRSVASYIWELDRNTSVEAVRGFCQDWAAATQRQLAPESLVAVLRLREVYANDDLAAEQEALLTTGYRFELVAGQAAPIELGRRVARLRAEAPRLRFREGQYGGHQLPLDVRPFELAPPQTVGAQPLYLTARPAAAPDAPDAWPWGLSALRLSVRYAARAASRPDGGTAIVDAGVAGAAGQPGRPLTLWWQAPQYRVQFRSALHSGLPAAGLPKRFRAAAVRALLPVVSDPQMPAQPIEPAETPDDPLSWWQPVLPGALRYLIAGARPGVMFAIRNQLLRQRLGGLAGEPVLVSGSVPMQQRAPRPVPLPPNAPAADARQAVALRAWASHFLPDAGLRIATSPLDEAFFAGAVLPAGAPGATVARPARGLLLRLVSPPSGKIDSSWDRAFLFEAQPLGASSALADWTIELTAQAGGRALVYTPQPPTGNLLRFEPAPLPPRPNQTQPEDPRDALLGRSAPGDTIALVARAAPAGAGDGFRQMLIFTLRVGDEAGLPLPLEPTFIHFEDPEYNRRLVSQSASASQLVALADADKRPLLKTLTLAADRREYNPGSVLALRYDWDDPQVKVKGQLELRRIDINGIETVLVAPLPAPPPGVDGEGPGLLRQFSLLELERAPNPGAERPPLLRPGDTLQLKLIIKPDGLQVLKEDAVVLEVRIVADPVIPVPEAGYALLRRQTQNGQLQVECARFAWGPNASRIELVDANDLRTEVVRRRAVFQWQDAARPGTLLGYAIQKLTMGGSTHGIEQWVAAQADE
jgi:hypothetical protein